MSEPIIEDAKPAGPVSEEIDYKKELMTVLKFMSSLGLQVQVFANNTEGKIADLEAKQKLV